MDSFWDSHGTKIELSGPHAPWQNGTTERHAGLIKLLVRQFFEDTDDELGPQVGANFPLVLDLLTARKNEAPGGANVSDVSAYEAFFGRRPQSAFLLSSMLCPTPSGVRPPKAKRHFPSPPPVANLSGANSLSRLSREPLAISRRVPGGR